MRIATLAFLLSLAAAAFAGRTETTIRTDDHGDSFASFARDGVRYETRDRDVIRALDRVTHKRRDMAREYREIGRKHREIAREQARIGREYAGSGDHAELEKQQEKLEARLDELEREQDALEERQRAMEDDLNREIEEIFAKAAREGKARRTD